MLPWRLTNRLSDAGMRQRPTKLIYPDYRLPSLAHRRHYPRDRSNRLLDDCAGSRLSLGIIVAP